jgi:hypothetical protein
MSERLPDPPAPKTAHEPADPEAELGRRNMIFGLALFGFVLILFAATIGIALVYLALD